MKFFFDHDVAADVAMVLRQRGHDVVELRTVLPADSADEIVWAHACADGRIMVSCNRNTKEPKGKARHGVITCPRGFV